MKTKVQLSFSRDSFPFQCELCNEDCSPTARNVRLIYQENGEMVDHFYHSNCIGIELANIITANEERDAYSDARMHSINRLANLESKKG